MDIEQRAGELSEQAAQLIASFNPKTDQDWLWLAIQLARQPHDALFCYEQALALDPANQQAKIGLEWAKGEMVWIAKVKEAGGNIPTVECKDCKTMVSTGAEVCPHCGAKYPTSYIPSKIIVHRKPALTGMVVKMTISADEEKVGELKQDEMITFDLPFGDHTIKAKANVFGFAGASGQISIRILPARVYRIEASFGPGGVNFRTEAEQGEVQIAEQTAARMKSYTGSAVLVFFLYWLFWLPGLIVNYIFYREAKQMERTAGQSLPGVGCLSVMPSLNVLGVVLGIGAGFVLFACGPTPTPGVFTVLPTATPVPPARPTAVPTSTPLAAKPAFEVRQVRHAWLNVLKKTCIHAAVEIKNKGNRAVELRHVVFTVYDVNSKVLEAIPALLTAPRIIRPGEVAYASAESFREGLEPTQVGELKVNFDYDLTSEEPQLLSVKNLSGGEGYFGYEVNGEVVNTSGESAGMIYVAVPLYDEGNNLLGVLYGYPGVTLAPGDRVGFKAFTLPPSCGFPPEIGKQAKRFVGAAYNLKW